MKKFTSVLLAALLIVSVLSLSASAIYEIQDTYDYCAKTWYDNNGNCIANLFVSYDTGLSWWFACDAEVETRLELSPEIDVPDVNAYVYAEIRNDYVGHMDSDYSDTIHSVSRYYTAYASIDDVYATYIHHNTSFKYKNETRQEFPVTYGER